MHSTRLILRPLLAAMLAAAAAPVVAQSPYYNPANPSSETGKTSGHELFDTIGCPGQGILGTGCKGAPAPAAAPAKPAAAPAPVVEAKPAKPAEVQAAQTVAPKAESAKTAAVAPAGKQQSVLYVPTGMRETSGLMVERFLPDEIPAGHPFDYKLKVTNLTPASLKDVSVQDVCADNFVLKSSTPAAAQSNGNVLQWNLGELGANESREILVNGTLPAGQSAKSCVTAAYDIAACQAFNVVEPKLAVAVTAPESVSLCAPIPVRYEVSNPGTGTTRAAALTQNVPQGLTAKDAAQTEVAALGDLAPGATRVVETRFKAEKPGVYEFKPMASANPELKADAAATVKVTQPKLAVSKTGSNEVLLGRDVPYAISVSNTGDETARDLIIEETLPAGATLVSATDNVPADNGKLVWKLPELKAGETRQYNYVLGVKRVGDVSSETRVSAFCADAAAATAKTDVKGIPAVLLEVIDVTDPVEVGKGTTYVITATNQGSAKDINLRIRGIVEDSMKIVSSEGATEGAVSGNSVVFAPLPSLAAGDKAEWRVNIEAVKPADARFFVEMTSDIRTRPVQETEATTLFK